MGCLGKSISIWYDFAFVFLTCFLRCPRASQGLQLMVASGDWGCHRPRGATELLPSFLIIKPKKPWIPVKDCIVRTPTAKDRPLHCTTARCCAGSSQVDGRILLHQSDEEVVLRLDICHDTTNVVVMKTPMSIRSMALLCSRLAAAHMSNTRHS